MFYAIRERAVSHIVQDRKSGLYRRSWLVVLLLVCVIGVSSWADGSPVTTVSAATVVATLPPLPLPEQGARFSHVRLEEGLSHGLVLRVVQDQEGFIWFATSGGLNRYDGESIVAYKHDPNDPNSLGANSIWSLLVDSTGILWVGTEGGGLNRFVREENRFIRYLPDPTDSYSIDDNRITNIYEDRAGDLWIGTAIGGLNHWERAAGRFTHYQNDPDDPTTINSNGVMGIHEDRAGMLWVGTPVGLNRLDRATGRFTRYEPNLDDPDSLGASAVWTVLEDRRGMLWIGTAGGGVDSLDRETGRFTHYRNDPNDPTSLSHDMVFTLYEDRAGALWIGTYGGGLNRRDPVTGRFYRYQHDPADVYSLSTDHVRALFQDRDGNLWIGTEGQGVNMLAPLYKPFLHYRAATPPAPGLSNAYAMTLLEDGTGSLWIGTLGGGVNRLNLATRQFAIYRHDPADPRSVSSDSIYGIFADRQGVIWVGAANEGLNRWEPQTQTFTRYRYDPKDPHSLSNDSIYAVYEDRRGNLWVGTNGGGLNLMDRATGQFRHFHNDPADATSLSNDRVTLVYEDSVGILWVGTAGGGLNRMEWTGGDAQARFTRYQNVPGDIQTLSSDVVFTLYEDTAGALWVGTADGLNLFERDTETFAHYGERDGLPDARIACIREDAQGNLWLSTGRGLARFDPRVGSFRTYDQHDGLQSNQFHQGSCTGGPQGQLYFGGANGFNAFDPAQITDNPIPPAIVLTALSVGADNRPVPLPLAADEPLVLRWPDRSLAFEFSALNFIQPFKNTYAFRLEGFDADWNYTQQRSFGRYTNLPGGTYVLHLKGANNDGVWNETGVALTVRVIPPIWQRWWFRGLIVVLISGMAAGGFIGRIKAVEAQRRHLEQVVEQRTVELRAANTSLQEHAQELEMRNTELDAFAHTVAHDLKNPLGIIVGFSLVLESHFDELSPSVVLENIQRIARTSKKMNYIIEEMLLFSRMRDAQAVETQALDMGAVVNEALERLRATVGDSQAEIRLPDHWDVALGHAPWIEEVWANYLSNALKYGGVPPRVEVGSARLDVDSPDLESAACAWQAKIPNSQGKVVFWVQDNGAGLTPEEQGRLFTMFTRLDAIHAKGHGLGLSIVRRIVEKLGGDVGVESTPGAGSRFWFALPAAPSDDSYRATEKEVL